LESYRAILEGKQGVILANANVITRMMLGAALTNENVACFGELSAVNLYSQSLAF
jgi:hypothetical protein